jgi:hypothetical protein
MHRGRTGLETLALAAAVLGVDRARVSRVLELTGLDAAAAAKRVGQPPVRPGPDHRRIRAF